MKLCALVTNDLIIFDNAYHRYPIELKQKHRNKETPKMHEFFISLALTFITVKNVAAQLQGTTQSQSIVGGVEVERNRYPYQVALIDSTGSLVCGGSLVDKDWVLSAAHCQGYASQVLIGSHDLTDGSEDREEIEIACETAHPAYNFWTLNNDYMMVNLKQSSQFSPVTLDMGSANLVSDTDLTVMGWGTTEYGGNISPVLLEAETDYVTNSKCNSYYSGDITSNMMCAARDGIDSCQGDSGGPLIIKGADASDDVQVGIVSWGIGCADPNYPGVYARVSEKIDWINDQISSGRGGSNSRRNITEKLLKFMSKVKSQNNLRH